MSYIKKRLILKGRHPGILTVSGDETSYVSFDDARDTDGLMLFSSPSVYFTVKNGFANMPARDVVAASLPELLSKGQLSPFDWNKAAERIRLDSYMKSSGALPSAQTAAKSTEPVRPINADIGQNIESKENEDCSSGPASPHVDQQEHIADTVSHVLPRSEASEQNDCAPGRFICPAAASPRTVKAFSDIFPESDWLLFEYRSTGRIRHYLTGVIYGEVTRLAAAVPGEPDNRPGWLAGFDRYLRDDDGTGYWVMITAA